MSRAPSLDLGVIGNCTIWALVDREARIVWCCLPRFDGDPVFNALLGDGAARKPRGFWAIELEGLERSEQEYDANTAVLRTRLFDRRAGDRDHRLRAALLAPGPHVPAADAGAARAPARRHAAHPRARCGPRFGCGAHRADDDARQQPHPLRAARTARCA